VEIEGRKLGLLSKAFSNQNLWDLGMKVGMLRMIGM
jgi:hypothetical protein